VACLGCGLPCLETPPFRAGERLPPSLSGAAPRTGAPLDDAPAAPPAQGSAGAAPLAAPLAAPAAAPAPPHDSEPDAPAALAQGDSAREPLRLRLIYEKRGPSAYLSHLDLVRQLPRILRRAGLRPAYTQGFNPRPRFQFTPPLPLGAEAEADACEVWVALGAEEPPDAQALLSRLGAGSLPGLRFHGARWLSREEPGLSRLCEGAVYRFEPSLAPEREALEKSAAALWERSSLTVERQAKGKGSARRPGATRDLRASLEALEVGTAPSGRLAITFRLGQRPEGTLRPRELVETLLGHPDPEGTLLRLHHVHREGETGLAVLTA
jgi:radical SAM-linked protein